MKICLFFEFALNLIFSRVFSGNRLSNFRVSNIGNKISRNNVGRLILLTSFFWLVRYLDSLLTSIFNHPTQNLNNKFWVGWLKIITYSSIHHHKLDILNFSYYTLCHLKLVKSQVCVELRIYICQVSSQVSEF